MNWKEVQEPDSKKHDRDLKAPRKRGVLFLWVAVLLVSVMLLLSGYAWANLSVTLVDGEKEITVKTFTGTVAGVLQEQGIVLKEKDEVNPPGDTPLEDGMVITVSRAADVSVTVDGNMFRARTRGQVVGDLLAECNISLSTEDEVYPTVETPVTSGMSIVVARISTDTIFDEAPLKYETVKQFTTKLPQGSTRQAQQGQAGIERRTWQVTFRNGKEVDRQLVNQEVVAPPVDRLIMVGSTLAVSRGGEKIRYTEATDLLATAYTYTGNNTASGVAPHYGAVAVDTQRIPMGTRLYVDGYGYATALDRGGAIKGDRIDLFFESHGEAVGWGVRWVKVYFLD